MLQIFNIIILGAIQGLTEFLPVSSSGHLVIFQNFLDMGAGGMTLDIFLHTGTLAAVIVIFRKDIMELMRGFLSSVRITKTGSPEYVRLFWLVIAANVPAGIAGVFFKDYIELFFAGGRYVYIFLIITGGVLFLNRFVRAEGFEMGRLRLGRSVVIGIAQMFAILPGISRSGMTITAGLLLGLKREDAVRFSFFLMMPAVLGATLLEILEFSALAISVPELIIGMSVSFITGYGAIKLLLWTVKKSRFHLFSYYCVFAGITGLMFLS
ncbi:MAG: undecaprenyl-diphosphate phosphatase [Elusimicrobiota bacterium]